jgi:hypothetical protein
MFTLVDPLTITCRVCDQQLSVPVLGIEQVEQHDGHTTFTPHLDHVFLAEHFASHNNPKD